MEQDFSNGPEYPNPTWARAVRQIDVLHKGGLLSDAAKEWADILVIDLLVWSDAKKDSELLVEKGSVGDDDSVIFLVYAEDVTQEYTKGCQFSLTHVPENPRRSSAQIIKLVLGQMEELDELLEDFNEDDFVEGKNFDMLDLGDDEDEEDNSEDWKKLI